MRDKPLIIAIDGPAGSGKSTVAARIAISLGITLLDTGAIYRAVAYAAREQGVSWDRGDALAALAVSLPLRFEMLDSVNHVYIGEADVTAPIRTPEISGGASKVSAIPAVRQALLDMQRRFAAHGPVVAEGRDMGTVVFPEAQVKVYLEADPRERARRRQDELQRKGIVTSEDQVLQEQSARDKADMSRDAAPLRAAEDARVIDTTGLTIDQVVQQILSLVPA